jgi:hypothetical protein
MHPYRTAVNRPVADYLEARRKMDAKTRNDNARATNPPRTAFQLDCLDKLVTIRLARRRVEDVGKVPADLEAAAARIEKSADRILST